MFLCLYVVHLNRFDPGIPKTQTWIRGPITVSFLIFALGSAFSSRIWIWILANPLFKFFSFISYNLYLWHQFIGHKLLMAKIPYYEGDPHYNFSWQVRFLLLAVSGSSIITWLLTRFFEDPILNKSRPKN
jgi:peptidoglycan/LPS O-acetylase OafA/YrhL